MKKDDILRKLRGWAARLPKPASWCSSAEFNQRTYARSAALEAIRLVEESDRPPYEVMEWFLYRLDKYACSKHPYSFAFSISYDTVTAMFDEVFLK